jgi:hypothetical protein
MLKPAKKMPPIPGKSTHITCGYVEQMASSIRTVGDAFAYFISPFNQLNV